jgi:hypothetical protein
MTALATQPARAVRSMKWHDIIALGRDLTGQPNVKGHFSIMHGEHMDDVLGKRGWAERATAIHDELHADEHRLMRRPHFH